jgi:hypothetical protein
MAAIKGSRDPLGLQTIWARLGERGRPLMPDWRNFCRDLAGMSVNRDVIEVVTSGTGRHYIVVRETPDVLES